jgi:hypothetical protein
MIVGIPKETVQGERRVALVPDLVGKLTGARLDVIVEPGAGEAAGFADASYVEKGARLEADVLSKADVVLKVQPPTAAEIGRMKAEATLIGLLSPYGNAVTLEAPGRTQGHRLLDGAAAQNHAGPAHGRAQRDEHGLGLQGRAPRRRPLPKFFPSS